jgi:hypothetical protein
MYGQCGSHCNSKYQMIWLTTTTKWSWWGYSLVRVRKMWCTHGSHSWHATCRHWSTLYNIRQPLQGYLYGIPSVVLCVCECVLCILKGLILLLCWHCWDCAHHNILYTTIFLRNCIGVSVIVVCAYNNMCYCSVIILSSIILWILWWSVCMSACLSVSFPPVLSSVLTPSSHHITSHCITSQSCPPPTKIWLDLSLSL